LDDAIHKVGHYYEHDKNRSKEHHSRKEKCGGKYDQQKNKRFKFSYYKNQPKNDHQGQQGIGGSKQTKPAQGRFQEPIQCWGCGENHKL